MTQIIEDFTWIFYIRDTSSYKSDKVGKWMYFFSNKEFAEKICRNAVDEGVVNEAKHTNGDKGVCCFYINGDEDSEHKKVINFFIKNNLIRKTKKGKYFNITFKYDNQTYINEYRKEFNSEIKLEDFINLETGEFIK